MNHIVVFNTAELSTFVNVGADTAPETFALGNKLCTYEAASVGGRVVESSTADFEGTCWVTPQPSIGAGQAWSCRLRGSYGSRSGELDELSGCAELTLSVIRSPDR